jgi:pyruvate/2-oxoglutarate/acetoin dehydrogenase E1 component
VTYYGALTEAMAMLAEKGAIFVGQGVRWKNNAQFGTLGSIPDGQRIELPVIEDFQAGFCLGLAMQGFLPVCIYPRFDFMLLAANQIVTHIDKLPMTSFAGKVIIRVGVGAKYPLDSGKQHTNDYSAAFRLMCKSIEVIELDCVRAVMPGYERALAADHSCMVVERQNLFGEP